MCTTGFPMSAILLAVLVMLSTVAGYQEYNWDLFGGSGETVRVHIPANPGVIESMESKRSTTPMPETIIPETPCSEPEKLELRCLRVQRRIFHDEELAQIRQNQEQELGTMKRQHLQRIFDFELRAAKAKAEQAELELQMVKNRYVSH